jgi:putative flippase GtrA
MISIFTTIAGRLGIADKEAERFFKFSVVGVIGFIVDFGTFNLLLNPLSALLALNSYFHLLFLDYGLTSDQVLTLVPTLAGMVSFVAAIISNFIWNRYWTYPDSRSKSFRRQFAQFVLVSVTGILMRIPIMAYTYRPFGALFASAVPTLIHLAERIGKNLALMLSVVVVMFWNFFVNRYWTYSDVS